MSAKGAVKGCEKGSGVCTMRVKTEPAENGKTGKIQHSTWCSVSVVVVVG